jgi:hypothetical protein
LEERGLFLGEVVNASPHNRKGNKENKLLRTLNDDVLAMSGGAWDKPPESLIWDDTHRLRRDSYISTFENIKIWGFKDPRVVLTLPFWQEGLPCLKFVGTYRHPYAVVASLTKRKNMAPSVDPLTLWKSYNRLLLSAVEQYKFPLVCFDWPSDKYLEAIDRVSLSLDLPPGSKAPRRFFEEGMRTSNPLSENDLEEGSEELYIYQELLKRSVFAS